MEKLSKKALALSGSTEATLRFISYRRPVSILSIACLSIALISLLNKFGLDRVISRNAYWTSSCFIFLLNAPAFIVMIGFLLPMKTSIKKKTPNSRVRSFRKLNLCIVTRGTNPEAVIRSCEKMRHLQEIDNRVKICIVTDEPSDELFKDLDVDIIATPSSFQPAKALYKARALEWFRTSAKHRDDDWVLHLDEETVINEHTVKTCIQFIEHDLDFEFGQGIIVYNAHKFWHHVLPTIADIPRARDDYGKFFVTNGFLNFPFLGVHGSFLLISGKVQNAVGWDTDSSAEDNWFGLEAWKRNLKIGWVPSIAREQSPHSILDSWRQRSRWFGGMTKNQSFVGRLNMLLWCLETVGTPIIIAVWQFLRVPYWMYVLLIVCNISDLWSMIFACIVQDIDAGKSLWTIALHAVFCAPLGLVCKWLESFVILYTIICPPEGFHIIAK